MLNVFAEQVSRLPRIVVELVDTPALGAGSARSAGSSPAYPTKDLKHALVAQLVEQLNRNQQVGSPSLSMGTIHRDVVAQVTTPIPCA